MESALSGTDLDSWNIAITPKNKKHTLSWVYLCAPGHLEDLNGKVSLSKRAAESPKIPLDPHPYPELKASSNPIAQLRPAGTTKD